jgi:predicted  nucleic acid-binding Zn-ribbon protein
VSSPLADQGSPNNHYRSATGRGLSLNIFEAKKAGVTLRRMPTDVDPAALGRLLDLQLQDTAIKRLEERRASLPEAQRLTEVSDQVAELDADLAIARKQLDEIAREQARLEGEIGLVADKITREEQRLFAGSVSNPKELSSLQAEVEMLKRKKSGLEDELLEIMVQRDGAAETVSSLESERATAGAEADELTAKVAELTGAIDSDLASRRETRSSLASGVPDDLLALYDRLRDQKGGVGAAALQDGTCQGCHTKLPAKEVERLRSERGLQRCDNCRRILVVP